jgi:TP901 family phage tail tape measure protein
MSKIKEDISRVRVQVDGKEAINELGKLEMEAKELQQNIKAITNEQKTFVAEAKKLDAVQASLNKLVERAKQLKEEGKESTKEYIRLQSRINEKTKALRSAQEAANKVAEAQKRINQEGARLDQTRARVTQLRDSLGLAGMTMGQLIRHQKDLTREITYGATFGTQRYRELQAQIQQVNGVIRQQRAELNGTAGIFHNIAKEVKQFGMLALGYLGASAFFTQVQSMIEGSAKLSDELADVQKVTGLTDQEMQRLNKTLGEMNTRTSRSELRGLAEIAGRLGLQSSKDIEAFVSAADKINVALGDSLGEPEKVMRELGKLTETFGVREEFGIEDSLLKIGSAINELGMASTANEGYLVEFSKRLGGVAPLAKISLQNVLGLGATLDSLGQTAEVSTTALSKLFLDMAKNSEVFAKQAKMDYGEFVELLNTDANEAFIRVLEGVKGNSQGLTELAATLGDVGADGGRVIGVLGTLANNTERLREQQRIANDAFREGTSVVNEFNLKNENMAANLAKIQKWMASFFVNSTIMEGLGKFVGMWAKWIEFPISRKMEEERMTLNRLYAQVITTNEGTAQRVKLINELKSLYPGLLKDINAETASNEELRIAVKAVNEQLVNKIILQRQDEKIQKQLQVIADRQLTVIERENKLRDQANKLAEKYGFELKAGVSTMEQFADAAQQAETAQSKYNQLFRGRALNDVTNFKQGITQLAAAYELLGDSQDFGESMANQREELIKRLGITLDDVNTSTSSFKINDEDLPETPTINNEQLDKAIDAALASWQSYKNNLAKLARDWELSQMEAQDRELEQTKDRFAALEEELLLHYQKKVISQQEYDLRTKELTSLQQEQIDAINLKYEEQRKAKEIEAEEQKQKDLQRITEATMEERELAELKIQQHYDALLELARKYGVDEKAIHDARRTALDELATKWNQKEIAEEAAKYEAKKQMAMAFASVATGTLGLIANFSGETAKYDRTMAIAKAAINSGEAIANMIKMFSATSFTPIDLAAKIAAGTGIILTNVNSALRTVNRASIPEAPQTPEVDSAVPVRGRGSSSAMRSFFMGGPTSEGMGFGDRFGEFAGFVHKNEYVIPTIVAKDPIVANLLPAIEAIRQDRVRGFAMGGPTSGANSGRLQVPQAPMNTDEMTMLLRSINNKLDKMPSEIRAYLVYNDLEKMKEEMDKLKSRYSA